MMPHTNIESINLNQSAEEILEKITNFHRNRILVKKKENDEIFGILEVNKVFKFIINHYILKPSCPKVPAVFPAAFPWWEFWYASSLGLS